MHCEKGRKSEISISRRESKWHPEVAETATILAAKSFMVPSLTDMTLSMIDMTAAILTMAAMISCTLLHALHLWAGGGGSCELHWLLVRVTVEPGRLASL